jgi:hypothetical protein
MNVFYRKQLCMQRSRLRSFRPVPCRICQAVRNFPVEMPLTVPQLRKMGVSVLVDVLAKRRHHLLALRIADFTGCGNAGQVVSRWAMDKIRSRLELTDEQLCQLVVGRVTGRPTVSFAAIARAAGDASRPHLALMLVDHEPSALMQVKVLISLGELTAAVEKATAATDPDLVATCILAATKG